MSAEGEKQVRVYVDMVADLFHYGHVEFIKKARSFGTYMIVGLCSDEECTGYKRRPVLSIEERTRSVQGCRYVDEVIPNCPLRITKEFMEEHKIDIVAHGDDFDQEKIKYWYGAAIDQGKFKVVPYTQGVSTTDLLNRIRNRFALDRPDHEKTVDAFNEAVKSSGFEATPFLVGHYNQFVEKSYRLDYPPNTLALLVISNSQMFGALQEFYTTATSADPSITNPVDACTARVLTEAANKTLGGASSYDIFYDHTKANPTSVEPRINIQTAGHVSGATYYYQRKLLDAEEGEDPWPKDKSIYGVSIHPTYGGWFAFRAVIVLKNVHPKIVAPAFPVDSLQADPKKIVELLEEFNFRWTEFKWRDIIPVAPENRYSAEQIAYYHTELENRDQSVLCAPRST